MKRVLVWLEGRYLYRLPAAVRRLEFLCGGIHVIGCAAPSGFTPALPINGRTLPHIKAIPRVADYVMLTGNEYEYTEVVRHFGELGFSEEQILPDRVLAAPGFTFEKYRQLRASRLSIISLHCAGGVISNYFCLPFRSPFVNMYSDEDEFIAMLEREPRFALQGALRFVRTEHNTSPDIDYPVYDINGLRLKMNHYPDFAVARAKWYERLQRVNWNNLLVMMHTERRELLERFERLPFGKKICFTTLETDLPSAWHLPPALMPGEPLWNVVDNLAMGRFYHYDLWDMLLYAKKTPLEN